MFQLRSKYSEEIRPVRLCKKRTLDHGVGWWGQVQMSQGRGELVVFEELRNLPKHSD